MVGKENKGDFGTLIDMQMKTNNKLFGHAKDCLSCSVFDKAPFKLFTGGEDN